MQRGKKDRRILPNLTSTIIREFRRRSIVRLMRASRLILKILRRSTKRKILTSMLCSIVLMMKK
jgi:hypothetical protein